ncbi:glycosyltransferase family 1 protein [Nakamurella antarctica]|uniref:glycogen phosphorylase n=1 Tax=Nakamurella antarctica TaxID=1902245 RepID=A0A3G8ZKL4_9ACTN|nr:alpha-glucan family phosphorylase [Nakamurella antarctica]AZI57852.1 glycosyltransferase family 1 protein [Nakamurella antarctica]
MKALRRFTVRPQLPEALRPLGALIRNLRWSWHPASQDLFADIDPELWKKVEGDPLRLLGAVSVQRLQELSTDVDFLQRMHALDADLQHYLTEPRWYQQQISHHTETGDGLGGDFPRAIAYFSLEFGVSEVLPNYSGGLGILAGDHLKSASDLGVPIVGIGLLYRFGYFWQSLNADGWQQEHYPSHDPQGLPLSPVLGADSEQLSIAVPMPGGRNIVARIWLAQVGRVPLLLLDTDIEANDVELRQVTDKLYGGDQDHRIKQEILVGIGGVRAVRAFCEATGHPLPEVFHMNEGHAGFLGLERIRTLIAEEGLTFSEAHSAVRAGTVFTTHTPVPAGIDRFPMSMVEHYLAGDSEGDSSLVPGLHVGEVLALGVEDDPSRFNMAHMGLRLAQRANGVAKLHGVISREMFSGLFPGFAPHEVPIGSVTNGVHLPTWASREMRQIAGDMANWQDLASAPEWPNSASVDGERLWELRNTLRARLVEMARMAVKKSWLQRGRTEAELGWTDSILDPEILTIGFARRVSTYKRLTLMLRDPARLKALLLDPDHPIQIVIAGKAHPADDGGKTYMQEMVRFTDDPEIRHRIVFLPDYDMGMAAILCSGADVWLNNPLRPQEASGTSGMKSALNGGLNLSISDGWWDELYDGNDGWMIPTADGISDMERRNDLEANALYALMENQVTRLFYDRGLDGRPGRWVDMVRHTLAYLGPRVQATRMVRDYVEQYYAPAAAANRAVSADSLAPAKQLAAWKDKVRSAWPQVRVVNVDTSGIGATPSVGSVMTVRAHVDLAGLAPSDVAVQAVMGRVGETDELHEVSLTPMAPIEGDSDNVAYEVELPLSQSGSVGYTVRVLPQHALLAAPAELGLVVTA